jgi:serine/threonine protein kinase
MSTIYTITGQFENSEEKSNDRFFFRKCLPLDDFIEYKIAKILLENPEKSINIVEYYRIDPKYIDMEKLNTEILIDSSCRYNLRRLKDFLHGLGIMYIDWKSDNFGMDNRGNIKLFDFDCSGIIDTKTNEWIFEPPKYFNYKNAIENGMRTPKEIDNYCFDKFLSTLY